MTVDILGKLLEIFNYNGTTACCLANRGFGKANRLLVRSIVLTIFAQPSFGAVGTILEAMRRK